MAKYAMVDSEGIVTNICEWDGSLETWQPPEGIIMIPCSETDPAEPGGTYDNGIFITKPNEVIEIAERKLSLKTIISQSQSFNEFKDLFLVNYRESENQE